MRCGKNAPREQVSDGVFSLGSRALTLNWANAELGANASQAHQGQRRGPATSVVAAVAVTSASEPAETDKQARKMIYGTANGGGKANRKLRLQNQARDGKELPVESALQKITDHADGHFSGDGRQVVLFDGGDGGQHAAQNEQRTKNDRTKRQSGEGAQLANGAGLEQAASTSNNSTELKCRVEKDFYLDFEDYRQYTCVNCYNQVPRDSFKRKLVYQRGRASAPPTLHDWRSGRQIELANETHTLVRSTFKDESIFDKWQACCRHAIDCCVANSRSLRARVNEHNKQQLEDEPVPRHTCPATWDGLTCWPESAAGQLAWRECPRHVYLLSFEPACAGYVTKQCFANGSWFIRNGHEWSDYSQCPNLPVYAKRMLFSALWHIISALVITPALLTIDKFSNRGGNKRVKILRSLLFWLLINSCIQAIQKAAIVSGLFEADSRSRGQSEGGAAAASPADNKSSLELRLSANSAATDAHTLQILSKPIGQLTEVNQDCDNVHSSAVQTDSNEAALARPRCKRQTGAVATQAPTNKRRRSALITFFCWSLVVASRTVRLMGYSWMFTGAIYLCSALHFAPAEPPAAFIRVLMVLTNAFPIVIAIIYITSRTIVEPSPLNIIFKVPYYKFIGDQDSVDYLWQTQLECWFDQSKYESIEDIADLPNLILICLNVGLFVITLVILCRIHRPGSTRPDMSPLTYFKAAGTLVVLYGGHYALLAYRPNSESCFLDTLMFYSFLFVDGIQGMAVSYVFCYRTHEGKTIMKKYWDNRRDIIQIKL